MAQSKTAVTVTLDAYSTSYPTVPKQRTFTLTIPDGLPDGALPQKARDAFVAWSAELFSAHLRGVLADAADWPDPEA